MSGINLLFEFGVINFSKDFEVKRCRNLIRKR